VRGSTDEGTIEHALETTDTDLKKVCLDNQTCLIDDSIGGLEAGQQALDQERSLQVPEPIKQAEVQLETRTSKPGREDSLTIMESAILF